MQLVRYFAVSAPYQSRAVVADIVSNATYRDLPLFAISKVRIKPATLSTVALHTDS